MIQKIIRVGHSAAVTINNQVLNELGFAVGDFVEIETNLNQNKLIVSPAKGQEVANKIVNREVFLVAKSLLKRYLPAFKKLSRSS